MGNYGIKDYHQSLQPKREKMNFFKRWVFKQLYEIVENQPIQKSRYIDQPDRSIQFTVYMAAGGRVVETKRYDRKSDNMNSGLYIITNEQDFGSEIDKIITMEGLRG